MVQASWRAAPAASHHARWHGTAAGGGGGYNGWVHMGRPYDDHSCTTLHPMATMASGLTVLIIEKQHTQWGLMDTASPHLELRS